MNNCLVTKLKGVVDNENLPLFGVTKILVTSAAESQEFSIVFRKSVNVSFNSSLEVKYIFNGSTVNLGTIDHFTSTPNYDYRIISPKDVQSTITIENKYNSIYKFDDLNAKLACRFVDFSFTNVYTLNIHQITSNTGINISDLDNSENMDKLSVSGIEGNIENLRTKTDLTYLNVLTYTPCNVYGDVAIALSPLNKLTNIIIGRNSNIHGSFDDVFNAWAGTKVTTTSGILLTIKAGDDRFTINGGTPLYGDYRVRFGQDAMVDPTPEEIAKGW